MNPLYGCFDDDDDGEGYPMRTIFVRTFGSIYSALRRSAPEDPRTWEPVQFDDSEERERRKGKKRRKRRRWYG